MRVGIVGPSTSVDTVISEADKADLPLSLVPLVYSHYSESVRLVEQSRSCVDAFLFTGTTPYNYALHQLQPEEPWGFLPRSVNSLLCAILKAVYMGGRDIRSVSADSYDEEVLRAAYAEIDLTGEDIAVFVHTVQVASPGYLSNLIDFHRSNVQSGRARLCITGVQAVYERLLAENIPVTKVFATSEIIFQQLQRLYLQHMSDAGKEHRIAVVSIQLAFARERSLYGKSDMQFFLYKTKAMSEVYSFAQRIGAAVEVHDNKSCHMYTTETAIERETGDFSQFSLLHELQKIEGVTHVAAGIGVGEVPADAKYHADLGKDRALKANASSFFIVYNDHRVVGPISDAARKKEKVLVDRGLNRISRKTGIGLDRLHQLERALFLHGLDTVTPNDLASLCNMSLGAVNRILAKLEKNGYLRVVGKQPSLPLGRPSRLIQILF